MLGAAQDVDTAVAVARPAGSSLRTDTRELAHRAYRRDVTWRPRRSAESPRSTGEPRRDVGAHRSGGLALSSGKPVTEGGTSRVTSACSHRSRRRPDAARPHRLRARRMGRRAEGDVV